MKKFISTIMGLIVGFAGVMVAGPASAGATPIFSASKAVEGQTIQDPSGKVVKVGKTSGKGKMSPKGLPGRGVSANKSLLALTYHYNTGTQVIPSPGSDGVSADEYVVTPTLDTSAGDLHSLQQIWAMSSDYQQVVEAGWVVSQNVNGDLNPHLFVYARKNGVSPTGWNGSFTAAAGATYVAGQDVSADGGGTAEKFGIQFFDGVWWVSYKNSWFGYFNPSTAGLWATSPAVTFNKVRVGQAGGEVLSNGGCSEMGNGQFGETGGVYNTNAGRSANWLLINPPSGTSNVMTLDPSTDSTKWRHKLNTGSLRTFALGGNGGPGC